MLKLLASAGAAVLLMGAAPAVSLSAAPAGPPAAQMTMASNDCDYNCTLICWKMTGDWGACEIACMNSQCLLTAAPPPLKMSRKE